MVGAINFFKNWKKICDIPRLCRECPIYEACGYIKGGEPFVFQDEDILELIKQVEAEAKRMEGQNGEKNGSKERQPGI